LIVTDVAEIAFSSLSRSVLWLALLSLILSLESSILGFLTVYPDRIILFLFSPRRDLVSRSAMSAVFHNYCTHL
jgi:hypothetical protein